MMTEDEMRARHRLDPSWMAVAGDIVEGPRMAALKSFLEAELAAGKRIHPLPGRFFAALNRTPLPSVKVVVLGQDPYHGPGQAHGFSFSVPDGVPHPPSLRNIFTELAADTGTSIPRSGCLEPWADQGVLLLNSVLSVEERMPASHANQGWEEFTDCIVRAVNDRPGHVAFVLWGSYAQRKAAFVDRRRHLIVSSVHPSPLSASRGFHGSRPFSKVNTFLKLHSIPEIDWNLNPARSAAT
jgi:uracil-DNA glycosylase